MRDMDRLNASGLGRSRGYAFVTFDKHEHALAALRDTNNSPNLFGEKKVRLKIHRDPLYVIL